MLDTYEKRPLYLQLTDALLKQIVDVYQADDKLPTEMELCDEYAVSRTTVRLAMSELERRGSIYRIQGRTKSPFLMIPSSMGFLAFNVRLPTRMESSTEVPPKAASSTLPSWYTLG